VKQWLAYIFICIFSFQVLPVKELGKLLVSGQMVEEIHEIENDGDIDPQTSKLKKEPEPLKYGSSLLTAFSALAQYFTQKVLVAIHHSANLPRQYVPDILTPPPNC
jgi:hypothetical protein